MRMNGTKCWVALVLCVAVAGAWGCKKKGDDAAKKGEVAAEVGSVAIPEPVLAFGGAKSMDDLVTAVGGLVGKFNPQFGALIGAQVPALLQGQVLGVKNLGWLDSKKPIKFAILDYKQYAKPYVLVMPLKGGKDALTAALPDNKAAAAPDNETKFAAPNGAEVFVNIVGDNAIFTMDAKAFPTAKAFLTGDFQKYPVVEILDIQASSANIKKVAAAEIAAARENLGQAAGSAAAQVPGMQELLKKEIDMLLDVVDQTEAARLVLKYDGTDLGLRLALKVVDGKGLAKFVAGAKDRKLEAYKSLPAGGWFVMASNIDPNLFAGWSQLGIDFWAELLKLNADEKGKLDGLMKSSLAEQTGDSGFAVAREGDFPLRVLSVTGIKDAEKARTAIYNTYEMLFSKVGVAVDQYTGGQMKTLPVKLDWTNFKAFTESLKPELAKAGIDLALKNQDVGGAKVDALELTVDYAKIPGGNSPDVAMVAKAVGNKVSGALGFDKGKMIFTFGKEAVGDLQKVQAEKSGGAPLADIIAKAGVNVGAAAYLSFIDLMKVIATFDPELLQNWPGVATATADAGFTLVFGGHGDRVFDTILTVPVAKIAAVMPKQDGGMGAAPVAPAPAPAAVP